MCEDWTCDQMSTAAGAGGSGMSPAPHLVGAAGPLPGHPAATSGTSPGQQWLRERSFSPGLRCTLLRRLAQLAGFGCRWQRRALRFVLMSYQGQQPWQQWAGTAQGGHWLHQHRLKVAVGKRPCSVPLSHGRHCCLWVPLCIPGAGCEHSSSTGWDLLSVLLQCASYGIAF